MTEKHLLDKFRYTFTGRFKSSLYRGLERLRNRNSLVLYSAGAAGGVLLLLIIGDDYCPDRKIREKKMSFFIGKFCPWEIFTYGNFLPVGNFCLARFGPKDQHPSGGPLRECA